MARIVQISGGNYGGVVSAYSDVLADSSQHEVVYFLYQSSGAWRFGERGGFHYFGDTQTPRYNNVSHYILTACVFGKDGTFLKDEVVPEVFGVLARELQKADRLLIHSTISFMAKPVQDLIWTMIDKYPGRVAMICHGVELRPETVPIVAAVQQNNPNTPRLSASVIAFHRQNPTIRCAVTTPDLLEYLPQATWIPHPIPYDHTLYRPLLRKTRNSVRVCHSYGGPEWNSTADFFKVMQSIEKQRPDVRGIGLTHIPCEIVLRVKQRSHINFGRLTGWYNMSDLEAMSMEVPTINWITPYTRTIIGDHPMVQATYATLEDTLLQLCDNAFLRHQVGQQSREWVKLHHSSVHTLAALMKILAL